MHFIYRKRGVFVAFHFDITPIVATFAALGLLPVVTGLVANLFRALLP